MSDRGSIQAYLSLLEALPDEFDELAPTSRDVFDPVPPDASTPRADGQWAVIPDAYWLPMAAAWERVKAQFTAPELEAALAAFGTVSPYAGLVHQQVQFFRWVVPRVKGHAGLFIFLGVAGVAAVAGLAWSATRR